MASKTITVPDVGGASDVEVIEILVKVGDKIQIDTPLLTLESDKATMDVPSSDAGTVKEIKVKVGDKIESGSPILILDSEDSQQSSEKQPEKKSSSKDIAREVKNENAVSKETPQKEEANPASIKEEPENTDISHAGPAVRQLARELGIELSTVNGSGPKNRVLKSDVTELVKSRMTQSASVGLPANPNVDFSKFGATKTSPLSKIKKLTGKNLHRNWVLVPHVTQFGEADITELEDFRQAQKSVTEKQGIKLTPLVFIMKAVVVSLKAFPQFNASLDPSGENLILKEYFHIGVAVDTPEGLVVPVIRDVDKKGLFDLATELSVISEKARNKKLTSNDMQGGCFSISSLGGIGGTAFTPIVNAPEVAILGVSKSAFKPIFQNGEFVPRMMLPLSLSYDHRVIDGADGARFIVHLSNMLSDIRNLLL